MAKAMAAARFPSALAKSERLGDMLSDSNSELSSVGEHDQEHDHDHDQGAQAAPSSVPSPSPSRDGSAEAESEARVHPRVTLPPAPTIKRKNSKWYQSDDDEDWEDMQPADRTSGAPQPQRSPEAHPSASGSSRRSESSAPDAGGRSSLSPPDSGRSAPDPASRSKSKSSGSAASANEHAGNAPSAVITTAAASQHPTKDPGDRRSGLQRFVDKTLHLGPFGGAKRKALDVASPVASPSTLSPHAGNNKGAPQVITAPTAEPSLQAAGQSGQSVQSPASDISSLSEPTPRAVDRRQSQMNNYAIISPIVETHGCIRRESEIASRRRSNTVNSPGSDAPVGSPNDTQSPGQRKLAGAFQGKPGSGVLLEGWLRQKQRRGVKGLKKWNTRYFVLFPATNEVRYYADVVQSAWGPIPLGEIGAISLRLIQRISKPSHPRYKGSRFDITCRSTWGTHYADDYVSSDDEGNDNVNNNAHEEATRPERTGTTPRASSRIYSLVADSPQTAVTWVHTIDSLLTRSANSPRVDSANAKPRKLTPSSTASSGLTAIAASRRCSSRLEADHVVLAGTDDVGPPKAVAYAIHFIFNSTPGIETERFYEKQADAVALKTALHFLNQFAIEPKRKPSKDDLGRMLDVITAGAVVKKWLQQREQPLVPCEMFDDYISLAAEAPSAPFDLIPSLRALVHALPPKNFVMLGCLLFHLNEVSVYSNKNGMDAACLASIFGPFILRPRGDSASPTTTSSNNNNSADHRYDAARRMVQEMILHIDELIDEKEIEAMDPVIA